MVRPERTGLHALAALLLLLGSAVTVQASPGDGIRLGGSSGRLHPYLELEGRYDSNAAYSTAEGEKTSSFLVHIRPGLTLQSDTGIAAVRLDAQADWAQYVGENDDLSRLFGKAELGVGFNRRGQLGLEVTDSFRRSSSTRVFTLPGAVVQTSNDLTVSVPWRPGGGALVLTVLGGWDLESFEAYKECPDTNPACEQSGVDELGYSDVRGGLDLRWRFLPRTAAVLQGEYWKRLPSDTDVTAEANGWRAWAGVAGLFSAHIAGTLRGGYGAVNEVPGSISSWLANAEVEWLPLETTSVKLGYLHDLGADPGQYGGYTSHRGYLEGRAMLAARYTPAIKASYENRDYPKAGDFSATLITVEPSVDVEVARWLVVGGGVAYTKRTSELPAGTPPMPGLEYDKTEVFVRVRGTY